MKEFTFLSKDGLTRIHAARWEPQGSPRAVLQFIHGMHEHVGWYARFAEYLAGQGFVVVGNDHLGHGLSVAGEAKRGSLAREDGNGSLLADIHTLRTLTRKDYPALPYFVLGHSMGSFLARQYLQRHGEGLAGAIIMGTGSKTPITLVAARAVCRLSALVNGWEGHSALLDKLTLGDYNRRFEPVVTGYEWITRDPAMTAAYGQDPLRCFRFTVNAYYNMFRSIGEACSPALTGRVPKALPILVTSGGDDPVGAFGKGVEKAFGLYRAAGIRDLTCKLYPGYRHELLNELEFEPVYADLAAWMEARLPG